MASKDESTQPISLEELEKEEREEVETVPPDESVEDTSQAPDVDPDTAEGPPPSQDDPPAPGGHIPPRGDESGV